jgi:hypothetical protein
LTREEARFIPQRPRHRNRGNVVVGDDIVIRDVTRSEARQRYPYMEVAIWEEADAGRRADIQAGWYEGLDDQAMLIAMHVGNAMEDFHATDGNHHVEGLDDDAMAKLNPVIRRAIYEALVASWSGSFPGIEPIEGADRLPDFLRMSVPDDWERPRGLPDQTGGLAKWPEPE